VTDRMTVTTVTTLGTSRTDSWGLLAGDDLVPGRVVHALLGGGISYEAYLVFDQELHYAAVAKVLRPSKVGDVEARRGLAREAALLERLRHPVVVRSLGAVLDGPRPHVLLEHLEGPRLSSLVRRHGPLALEQLLPLALELASALHHLRVRGLVHLDVKPGNVVMGAPPRLIDLSVARTVAQAAALQHVVGTDGYLAPEQEHPWTGEVGPAADVHGLGATLVHAATGRPPTGGGLHGLPDGVPARLLGLVRSCLAPRPTDRPTPVQVAEAVEPLIALLPRPVLAGFRPTPRR
jgi:serine/threonine protein kinase